MIRVHYQISGDDYFDIEDLAEGEDYEDVLHKERPIPSNIRYEVSGAEGSPQERPEIKQPKG